MATEDDDVVSISSRLTKGDVAPQKVTKDDCSTLTGDTRESKAQTYAAEETKKVTLQYVKQIDSIKEDNENKVAYLQAQLDVVLKRLQLAEATTNNLQKQTTNFDSEVSSSDINSKKDHCTNLEDDDLSEDNVDEGNKDEISGLSESYGDDQPIIVGMRNRKLKSTTN